MAKQSIRLTNSAVVSALNNKADIELENSTRASAIESLANSAATTAAAASKVADAAVDLIEVQMPLKVNKSGDTFNGNVVIDGNLTVTGKVNIPTDGVSGTVDQATSATKDSNGNVIVDTYLNKNIGGTINGSVTLNKSLTVEGNYRPISIKMNSEASTADLAFLNNSNQPLGYIRASGTITKPKIILAAINGGSSWEPSLEVGYNNGIYGKLGNNDIITSAGGKISGSLEASEYKTKNSNFEIGKTRTDAAYGNLVKMTDKNDEVAIALQPAQWTDGDLALRVIIKDTDNNQVCPMVISKNAINADSTSAIFKSVNSYGDVVVNSSCNLKSNVDNSRVAIYGGSNINTGGVIIARGLSSTINPGACEIWGRNSSGYKALVVSYDKLIYGNKTVDYIVNKTSLANGGLIIEYGSGLKMLYSYDVLPAGTKDKTITYPVVFQNAPVVIPTHTWDAGASCSCKNITTSNFIISIVDFNGQYGWKRTFSYFAYGI